MSYSSTVLADSPLLYWRLGESSGTTAADASGNSRPGTYDGAGVTYSVAHVFSDSDTAITLDGSHKIQRAASTDWDTSNFSIELWVRRDYSSLGYNPGLAAVRSGSTTRWSFHMQNDGTKLGVWNGSVYATVNYTFTVGTWYYVAVTWDGATRTYYVNGLSVGTSSDSLGSGTNLPFTVGDSTSSEGFQGGVDEVALYSTALSSTTIRNHFLAGLGTTDTANGSLTVARTVALLRTASDSAAASDSAHTIVSRAVSDIAHGTDSVTNNFHTSGTIADLANGIDSAKMIIPYFSWRPRMKPDSSLLLFHRNRLADGQDFATIRLWTSTPQGGNAVQVKGPPSSLSWTAYGHPEWSPDGSTVVVWAHVSSQYKLTLLDGTTFATGASPYQVTSPNIVADPSFSPDGTKIVFVECISGTYKISTVHPDGTNHTVLTTSSNVLADPIYSADGTRIVYTEEVSGVSGPHPYGRWAINIMASSGGAVTTILNDGNANQHPSWVTASQIVFQTFRYGTDTAFNIARIGSDGTDLTILDAGEYPQAVNL